MLMANVQSRNLLKYQPSLVKVEDGKSSESASIAMKEEGEFAEPASLVKEEEEDGFSESTSSAKEDYVTISTWPAGFHVRGESRKV